MDEKLLKTQFVASFLASWCERNYVDACQRGEHERLEEPPIEDAIYLSEKVYENLCSYI